MIKKINILSMFLLFTFSSCAMAPSMPGGSVISPRDAKRYEGIIKIKCNGSNELKLYGTSYCQFKEGEETLISVKLPPSEGNMVARSRRAEFVKGFNNDTSWLSFKWRFESSFDAMPIAIYVTGYDSGTQAHKIYPYVYSESRPKLDLNVNVYCFNRFQYSNSFGQDACQEIMNAPIDGSVIPKQDLKGEYLLTANGCEFVKTKTQGEFKEGEIIAFKVKKDIPGSCFVRSNVKYIDGSIGEHELYLDFFDISYVPLPKPIVSRSEEKLKFCAPSLWSFASVMDKNYKNHWYSKDCHKVKVPFGSMVFAWDQLGRMSYNTEEGN